MGAQIDLPGGRRICCLRLRWPPLFCRLFGSRFRTAAHAGPPAMHTKPIAVSLASDRPSPPACLIEALAGLRRRRNCASHTTSSSVDTTCRHSPRNLGFRSYDCEGTELLQRIMCYCSLRHRLRSAFHRVSFASFGAKRRDPDLGRRHFRTRVHWISIHPWKSSPSRSGACRNALFRAHEHIECAAREKRTRKECESDIKDIVGMCCMHARGESSQIHHESLNVLPILTSTAISS